LIEIGIPANGGNSAPRRRSVSISSARASAAASLTLRNVLGPSPLSDLTGALSVLDRLHAARLLGRPLTAFLIDRSFN
jgi:hypothetical protein